MSKTWLAGVGNHSFGGIYSFHTIEHAQTFVAGYFPNEATKFGVAQTTRIFDAAVVEEASRDMNSVHFGGKPLGNLVHSSTRKFRSMYRLRMRRGAISIRY